MGTYVRTIQRRSEDGSVVRYVQLAHNVRLPGSRNPVAQVIHSFGREEELDRQALARLVRSISRLLEPSEQLAASTPAELRFLGSRPFGGGEVPPSMLHRRGNFKLSSATEASVLGVALRDRGEGRGAGDDG
ncbi:hypothetical protein [Mycolicibacterium hassiacum]|uniref:hypothetical protein n=1 Tax=Mycolicibacterium hassiacum TaxID=46351 RepID=UPI0023FA3A70|nr:hypothetical protein [Mycolicibacterium hassiacum]